MSAPVRPLRVAIVAASLRILGGQAVQAQRMIDGWKGDPDVHAWLVPIDPVPIRPLDALLSVKYLRTLVTQLLYWPLLVRELRRADVVHVFSASYSSFLLAPLPAIVDREAAGTAGHPELPQRRSAGSSAPLRPGPPRDARAGWI